MSGLERVDYADRGTALTGWLARPAGPPRGGILVLPTIANPLPHSKERTLRLAEAGFVAFLADYYGAPVPDFAAAGPLASALRADVDHYRTRLRAALATLAAQAPGQRLSAIGFCMGGQAALELARDGADILLAASFHGIFETDRRASASTAHKPRILVLHGDADPLAPRDHVLALWDELDAAGYAWHFHAYAGVKHGFTDPEADKRGLPAIGYNASADRQSWAALLSLLDEVYAA